ncbi:MAG TPA: patatin-like phospholipase family protein, partial [Hanamia sp.]
MEENKIFHLGLCLAGSVSAGSYTAGVLDYLLDALKIWEERKRQNLPDTPTQDVRISVIGGASGGGMTGIIASSILQNEIIPVKFPTSLKEILADQPQNKLYNAWVDMLGEDMFPMMLDTADIDKNKEITSLLNSDFIDKLANKLVKAKENKNRNFPGYIYSPLKVFLTLTNLAGFPYEISYRGNTTLNKYYMAVHNDYACFKLNTDEAEKDEWMPLDFATGKNVETARLAAMATGAFPIFLKSRVLARETREVNKIRWLKYVDPVQGNEYVTQNIDGGILNNEPFEIVRFVLNELTSQPDSTIYNDPDFFKSTILLIDPFPSEKPADFKIDTGFLKTLAYTINCLVGQGRAKPGILASSVNIDLAGQFMIA